MRQVCGMWDEDRNDDAKEEDDEEDDTQEAQIDEDICKRDALIAAKDERIAEKDERIAELERILQKHKPDDTNKGAEEEGRLIFQESQDSDNDDMWHPCFVDAPEPSRKRQKRRSTSSASLTVQLDGL